MPFDLGILCADAFGSAPRDRRIKLYNDVVESFRPVGFERDLDDARPIEQKVEGVFPENAGLVVVTVPASYDSVSHMPSSS
jgi:hypothetical protein